jgi:hypothetical protein
MGVFYVNLTVVVEERPVKAEGPLVAREGLESVALIAGGSFVSVLGLFDVNLIAVAEECDI